MSKSAINQTSDYKKFKFHKKNRRINYNKVEKLAEAIKKNNLLHLFPIVVDPKFTILDGQHRFQAAKDIGAEIHYIISDDNYGIHNVADSNNFQSHWKVDDYVLYYASGNGKDQYKKLLHLCNKYMISPGVVAAIEVGNYHSDIKKGVFAFVNYDQVNEILEWAREFHRNYQFSHWNKRSFLRALRHIIRVESFDKKRLESNIEANRELLIKCHEPEDYIVLLENIYNKNGKPNLRFL